MSRSRRMGHLVLAVAGVAVLLVLASRWAGRVARRIDPVADGSAEEQDDDRLPARVAAASDAPDLSFYRALGTETGKPGTRGGDPDRDVPGVAPRPQIAPAGAPPSLSAGHEVFVVQVLATRDPAQARRIRDRLAGRGLATAVSEGRTSGRPVYRVRVGPYRDRSGAEAAARRLRGERGLSPFILREAGR